MTSVHIEEAHDRHAWDSFLLNGEFRPFLQAWEMGEVYRDIGEPPLRLIAQKNGETTGICQALIVDARRGRHLSLPYGPVFRDEETLSAFTDRLRQLAREHKCAFIRMSPFLHIESTRGKMFRSLPSSFSSPLHLLAEHIWHIPLKANFTWGQPVSEDARARDEEELFMTLRKTTRNLVRRAAKEGVTVRASQDPLADLKHFITLHDETRKRHGFTPYTDDFFEAQVRRFAEHNQCTLYLAEYQGEVIASSVHMHFGGETSYHHGASTHAHAKIPASYLLQWTAITDALKRGDHVYSFWGIAPEGVKKHPFAGVTLFKKGFGGELLELEHCRDVPVHPSYALTRGFEFIRKMEARILKLGMKVAFLDRDGTLIFEPPKTKHISVSDFAPLPNIGPALKALKDAGYALVVVSNQESGPTEEVRRRDFALTQDLLNKFLEQFSVVFDHVFLCPHRTEDACMCRKPLTGMVDELLREVDIDLEHSFMVGDRETDDMFASAIGVPFYRMQSNDAFPAAQTLQGLGNR